MDAITQWDVNILTYIFEHIQKDWLTPIMTVITHMGKGGGVWIVMIFFLLLFKKTRPIGIACTLGLLINVILCNGVIKPIVARPRPYDLVEALMPALKVKPQWDYSFPSGHTSASFATTSVLPWMKVKKRFWIPAICLAGLIGLSRLYVCVHYPTDVICGLLLGCLAGFLGFMLYTLVLEKRMPRAIMEFSFKKAA
ncbi:MAG: phosphatase PAP2 family protein [Lachnospiraceae bacterium]|nr:phosphatase PAP2 family protein [Lachnospiraceae bacterium]